MSIKTWYQTVALACFLPAFLFNPIPCSAEEEFTASVERYPYQAQSCTVIGTPGRYKVQPKDTLLDIARRNGLGYNELELLYPRMDGWIPPAGRTITVPTYWVVPPSQHEQLIINLAELRLYYLDKSGGTAQTYPIGIGDEGWESPLGTFFINEKRPNPTWYIPASLQAKYGMASMPPGPENPLGEFVMKFSAGAYGIHGTAMPWGVGRLVSHGCIRCYPEHIRILYPQVPVGTKLEIIYEPVKIGVKDNQVFVEAHPDVYKKLPDYVQYGMEKVAKHPLADVVDTQKLLMVLNLCNGVPTNVTKFDTGSSTGTVKSAPANPD